MSLKFKFLLILVLFLNSYKLVLGTTCTANQTRCSADQSKIMLCNSAGNAETFISCPSGSLCYDSGGFRLCRICSTDRTKALYCSYSTCAGGFSISDCSDVGKVCGNGGFCNVTPCPTTSFNSVLVPPNTDGLYINYCRDPKFYTECETVDSPTSPVGVTGSCTWSVQSGYTAPYQCGCQSDSTWILRGYGCQGSFSCATGWSDSCPGGDLTKCISSTRKCKGCGNDDKTCYKLAAVNGQCANNYSTGCTKGTFNENPVDLYQAPGNPPYSTTTYVANAGYKDIEHRWSCLGINGGTDVTNCTEAIINTPKCYGNSDCVGSCKKCIYAGYAVADCVAADPINGGWSDYVCNQSTCTETRSCNSPAPACLGSACSGSATRGCGYSAVIYGSPGSANGQSFCNEPASGFCSTPYGSYGLSFSNANQWWTWNCYGKDGTCPAVSGSIGPYTAYRTQSQCITDNYCSSDLVQDTSVCGRGALGCNNIYGTKANIDGICGGYNQGVVLSQPTSSTGLCSYSTSISGPTLSGTTWGWWCNGQCGGVDQYCYAIQDTHPILSSNTFAIQNTNSDEVYSEAVTYGGNTINANHICQSSFIDDKTARFVVTYYDPQGADDIDRIDLKLGTTVFGKYNMYGGSYNISRSGDYATATFNIPDNLSFSNVPQTIKTIAYDVDTSIGDSGEDDTGRYFKYWNCQVPVSGTVYDSSLGNVQCSTGDGFSTVIADIVNFKNLTFTLSGGSGAKSMKINSPSTYYSESGNHLIWGKEYISYEFNSDILMVVDPNFMTMRLNGGGSCQSTINLTDNSTVDPYKDGPTLKADFTGIVDQEPWWQTEGGVISNDKINTRIPVTCIDPCSSSLTSNIGFVSSEEVENSGKDKDNVFSWRYSGPSAKLANSNYGYDYFYNQYFVKKGVGITLVGNKNIADITGTTGIYFIDGNLNINADKTIDPTGFLMLIVKGDINVGNGVNQIDGILVANNIGATGTSQNDNPLIFNGSLYAANMVNFSRSFLTKRNNNTAPAVKIVYNPRMIFNLPGEISKGLTSWQWGN